MSLTPREMGTIPLGERNGEIDRVQVAVVATEDGPAVNVRARIYGHDGDEYTLTSAQARDLAESLLRAADVVTPGGPPHVGRYWVYLDRGELGPILEGPYAAEEAAWRYARPALGTGVPIAVLAESVAHPIFESPAHSVPPICSS